MGIYGSGSLGVNSTGAYGNASSIFDISSTTKGLLIPRMTQAQRDAIALPETSLIIFQTDNTPGYYYNSGTPGAPAWVMLASAAASPWTRVAPNVYLTDGTDNVGIGTTAPFTKFQVAGDNTMTSSIWNAFTAGGYQGGLTFVRTRGTVAAPTAVMSGDVLGRINFNGLDNTSNLIDDASIGAQATENFTGTAHGTNLTFHTTIPGTISKTEKMRISGDGNVGIGTTAPVGKLHINNDVVGSDSSLVLLQNGNVGFGTATPGQKLDVFGNTNISANLTVGGNETVSGSLTVTGGATLNAGVVVSGSTGVFNNGFQLTSGTPGAGKVLTSDATGIGTWQTPATGVGGSGTATQVAFWSAASTLSGNSNLYWDNGNSRLGIGTSSPGYRLEVSGTSRLSPSANRWANVDVDGTSLRLLLEDQSTATPKISFAGGAGTGTIETVAGNNMGLNLDVNATANPFKVRTYTGASLVDRFSISSGTATANASFMNSNVGIGTTAPAAKLDIDPGASFSGALLRVANTNSGNGSNIISLTSNGTAAALNISQTGNGEAGNFTISNSSSSANALNLTTNGTGKGISVSNTNASNTVTRYGVYSTVTGAGTTTTNVAGYFSATGATNNYSGIFENGNVGIGTTTVNQKLELSNGNVLLSNNSNSAGEIRLAEPSASGTNYTAFKAQAQAANITYTLPAAQGAANTVLTNDGSGNFSWSSVSSLANSWGLLGNASTIDGTNFIGTTDNVPFNIRVNNQKAGRIDHLLFNSFFGYRAGIGNTTGTGNTAVGFDALYNNNANDNSAFGQGALYNNSSGGGNTAIGYKTLNSNVAGSNATAIGYNSMYYANNTAAPFTNYNVAVGYEALRGSATPASNTGNYNTALGYQTLLNNTSGEQNTVVGTEAGKTNTTGILNTFIGRNAGLNSSSSSLNTFVGARAGFSHAGTGNDANSFFGYGAGFSNSTGIFNTFLGATAGNNNATGSYNVFVGNATAYQSTGSYNTIVGSEAAYGSASGDYNTILGTYAGGTAVNPIGSGNTYIGYNAKGVASLSNAAAIGKNANVTVSNTMVLGGTGADAVNVGIGTTAPLATLDITKDGGTVLFPRKSSAGDPAGATNGMIYYNANANKFRAYENGTWVDVVAGGGSSPWSRTAPYTYLTTGTDAVGIGTSTPGGKLHIWEDDANDELVIGEDIFTSDNNDNSNRIMVGNVNSHSIIRMGQSNNDYGYIGWSYNVTPANAYFINQTVAGGVFGGKLLLQPAGGNVGIGTDSPFRKLHIQIAGGEGLPADAGNVVINNNDFAAQSASLSIIGGSTGLARLSFGNNIVGLKGTIDYENSNNNMVFKTNTVEAMRIDNLGYVGIGTTAPLTNLHVASNTIGTSIALQVSNNGGNQGGFSFLRSRNTMAAPAAVMANDNLGSFGFIGYDGAAFGSSGPNAEISAYAAENFTGAAHGTDMIFRTTSLGSASAATRMIITSAGNVGIGTTAPKGKLHVAGDAALGDGTAANEGVVTVFLTNNTGAPSVKGEVVIADPAVNNSFVKTTTAGHTSVIGVVYESGVANGAPCKVAISGIVAVKADAATTRGQHCITGSTTAGAAGSVATPGAGTSIGVWLENVGSGVQGKVLLR